VTVKSSTLLAGGLHICGRTDFFFNDDLTVTKFKKAVLLQVTLGTFRNMDRLATSSYTRVTIFLKRV